MPMNRGVATPMEINGDNEVGSDRERRALEDVRILVISPRSGGDELVEWLSDGGYTVRHLDELEEFELVVDRWQPDVVAFDENLPALADRDWISRARKGADSICLLLVREYKPSTLDKTFDSGAEAFFPRDATGDDFLRLVRQELDGRNGSVVPRYRNDPPDIIGESPEMGEVCRRVAMAAPSDATVLLTGESGTGKELFARAIHRLSPRRDNSFVPINCGAIPEKLVESELFGHVEGAFTGAVADRTGCFEEADEGTLFLDEIGELPADAQVKLLRVLQHQRFEPVGTSTSTDVDVRLIAATNTDLEEAVEENRFRSDLYYRLNVIHLQLPPLRKRLEDIRAIWEHFIGQFADDEKRQNLETDPEVVRLLEQYDWPGNVRELGNVARHAVTMRDRYITPGCLPGQVTGEIEETSDDELRVQIPGMSLQELERVAILRTVEETETIAEAASMLGISKRKLYYRLDDYRDDDDDE